SHLAHPSRRRARPLTCHLGHPSRRRVHPDRRGRNPKLQVRLESSAWALCGLLSFSDRLGCAARILCHLCLIPYRYNPHQIQTKNQKKEHTMKISTVVTVGLTGLLLLALSAPALAEDKDSKGKEVTIAGEGKCAKCILKEADKCQTVIQAKEEGKTVNYYL